MLSNTPDAFAYSVPQAYRAIIALEQRSILQFSHQLFSLGYAVKPPAKDIQSNVHEKN
jgi:hypothetical protein